MTPPDTPEVAALRDLHRVVMLAHSGEDLDAVLQAAAEGVTQALGFECAAINLLTPRGDYKAVTCVGPGAERVHDSRHDRMEFERELSLGDAWGSLRFVPDGRYVEPADSVVWRSEEAPLNLPDAWRPNDALYAPLRDHRGEMLGILSVDLPLDRRHPDQLTRQCLEMYAVQIGLAIAHARERDQLRQRVRLSEVISHVVYTVSADIDLDAVLSDSLNSMMAGFEADLAWLRLFADESRGWSATNHSPDGPQDRLTVQARAESGDYLAYKEGEGLAATAALAQACWQQRRAVVVTADGNDTSRGLLSRANRDQILGWLAHINLSTFILFPVGTAQECLGYVVLSRSADAEEWSPTEETAAFDVGHELGRAIGLARVRQREAQLLEKMEEIDTHKNEMIATVVHELKNPLTSIWGNVELMQDDPEMAGRATSAIAFNVDRMLGLVQNMLTLSRLRDPSREIEAVAVDATAMVMSLESVVETQAKRSGVTLCFQEVERGVHLRGNREGFERMMVNLVSNAVKFSEPGDKVRIGLFAEAGWVTFSVSDDGMGISAEDQQHLFKEFQRSTNPAARSRPGTGLGLAIVAKVVERHGGEISVESDLGIGSVFRVRLPSG